MIRAGVACVMGAFVLVIAGCGGTEPGKEPTGPPLTESEPTIRFMRSDAQAYGYLARFLVENNTPQQFRYRGYGPGVPICARLLWEESGWEEIPLDWCWTGTSGQRLESAASFVLTAEEAEHERFRVGVDFWVTESDTVRWLRVWSDTARAPGADPG